MSISLDPNLLLDHYQAKQKKPSSELGKDAFLQILMTQLKNQNPLEPLQDKDFIAQMATFSSLEQLTNMNEQMTSMVKSDTGVNLAKYSEMIGKVVDWEQDSTEQPIGTGIVKSVHKFDQKFYLELADGELIDPEYVTKVSSQEG